MIDHYHVGPHCKKMNYLIQMNWNWVTFKQFVRLAWVIHLSFLHVISSIEFSCVFFSGVFYTFRKLERAIEFCSKFYSKISNLGIGLFLRPFVIRIGSLSVFFRMKAIKSVQSNKRTVQFLCHLTSWQR